jgi:membrane protease YdiL (CAAX protease family)
MDHQQTPPPLPGEEEKKPGVVFLVATSLLVALNAFLQFGEGRYKTHNDSYAIGSGMSAVIIPGAVALIFSIGKRFRNSRSRTRIVFWTSILIFFSTLGNLGQQMTGPK